MASQFVDDTVGHPRVLAGRGGDVLQAPIGNQFRRCASEGVGAGEGGWWGIEPLKQFIEGTPVQGPRPAFHQPGWKRPAGGRVCLAQSGQRLTGGLAFPGVATQDGIDESTLGSEAELAGEGDGIVDDGVIGDAIQPEQLVEAEAEQ